MAASIWLLTPWDWDGARTPHQPFQHVQRQPDFACVRFAVHELDGFCRNWGSVFAGCAVRIVIFNWSIPEQTPDWNAKRFAVFIAYKSIIAFWSNYFETLSVRASEICFRHRWNILALLYGWCR